MVRRTSSSQQCLLVVTFGQLVHSCYTSGSGYQPLCHSPTCLDCQRCYTIQLTIPLAALWKRPGTWLSWQGPDFLSWHLVSQGLNCGGIELKTHFLCGYFVAPFLGYRRQETRDKRQETGDRRQETGDRRQKTRDRRQGTRDRRHGTADMRTETGDRGQ